MITPYAATSAVPSNLSRHATSVATTRDTERRASSATYDYVRATICNHPTHHPLNVVTQRATNARVPRYSETPRPTPAPTAALTRPTR